MVIEYAATPADVEAAFRYNLKHSTHLRRIMCLGALLCAATMLTILTAGVHGRLLLPNVVIAVAFGAGFPIFFPSVAKRMAKPQTRTLWLERPGITTTIGSQHGTIPWSEVAAIAATDEHIFISGKNGNAFAIPRRAFRNEEARRVFLETANDLASKHGRVRSARGLNKQ